MHCTLSATLYGIIDIGLVRDKVALSISSDTAGFSRSLSVESKTVESLVKKRCCTVHFLKLGTLHVV
jgi:hypothetical protein